MQQELEQEINITKNIASAFHLVENSNETILDFAFHGGPVNAGFTIKSVPGMDQALLNELLMLGNTYLRAARGAISQWKQEQQAKAQANLEQAQREQDAQFEEMSNDSMQIANERPALSVVTD